MVENMVHDYVLRRTMLSGHLKAWLWQDEWHGLTMEDIRAIEKETAAELKKRREELTSAMANNDTCNDIKVVNDFGGSEPL